MTVVSRTQKHLDKTCALASRINGKAAAAGAFLMVSASSAMATETSAAQQAFDQLQTEAEAMAASAWPVVAGIVGSLLAIGLFKKFANKST